MKFCLKLILVAAIIISNAESRSLSSITSFEKAQNEGVKEFEKLLTDISQSTSIEGIIDDEEFESQWLDKLQFMLQDFFARKNSNKNNKNLEIPNDFSKSKNSPTFVNGLQNFNSSPKNLKAADSIAELEIYHQDNDANDALGAVDEPGENDAYKLDAMLTDLENQINRMKKYSQKLCMRKHQSTSFNSTDQKSLLQDANQASPIFGLWSI